MTAHSIKSILKIKVDSRFRSLIYITYSSDPVVIFLFTRLTSPLERGISRKKSIAILRYYRDIIMISRVRYDTVYRDIIMISRVQYDTVSWCFNPVVFVMCVCVCVLLLFFFFFFFFFFFVFLFFCCCFFFSIFFTSIWVLSYCEACWVKVSADDNLKYFFLFYPENHSLFSKKIRNIS